MAERKLLLDDASLNAIGTKRAACGGARAGSSAERKKLILAIVGLVMAGGMLGYFQVLGPKLERDRAIAMNRGLTLEEQRSALEQEKERAEAEKDPRIMKPGP